MPIRGGGQGPAQISWSTFDYSLLNLDNLKKGGGLGPAQILWSNLVLGMGKKNIKVWSPKTKPLLQNI